MTFVLTVGCFGPSVSPPNYSPTASADAAMSEYDSNKDGKIDQKELERSPALKNSLDDLDLDKDKAIGRDELVKRLTEFSNSKIALMNVGVRITRAGQPLANANVKFVPESFHGAAIKPASGKSDAQGSIEFRTEGSALPGLAQGFYRVEVSVKDDAGQETIPATFNTNTTLGQQVRANLRGSIEIKIP